MGKGCNGKMAESKGMSNNKLCSIGNARKEVKLMTEEIGVEQSSDWKKFLRKHCTMVAAFVVAVILAIAGAVCVFWWFTGNAQTIGLVPSTLSLWTMNNVVMYILHLIFWELVLIGIPVAVGAVLGWQWWKRLPAEEKEYHFFGRGSRTTSGGSGVSLLFFVAFCIKVYIDGNWNVAIASWTLDYVVISMISILVWTVIVVGIPVAIGIIWWINHEMRRKPRRLNLD
jgi:hypothetical protein